MYKTLNHCTSIVLYRYMTVANQAFVGGDYHLLNGSVHDVYHQLLHERLKTAAEAKPCLFSTQTLLS